MTFQILILSMKEFIILTLLIVPSVSLLVLLIKIDLSNTDLQQHIDCLYKTAKMETKHWKLKTSCAFDALTSKNQICH